jgi:hypothetical protein
MNRRDRLMATLRGETVDRPAVSFYELNGLDEDAHNPDPFNIYSHPSWAPLIALTREKTDRIVMRKVDAMVQSPQQLDDLTTSRTYYENGSRYTHCTLQAGSRRLTSLSRHDPDVNTVWELEHLLKDVDDLKAWLELPAQIFEGGVDLTIVHTAEEQVGEAGIVMIDTPDPLCLAAQLFDMATYTIIALTEPVLFHHLLERMAAVLHARTQAVARALPGRLWRIVGPEYAAPPYLPPRLFREYVTRYDTPMVSAINAAGGYARLHCHGKLRRILDDIAATNCVGLDPIEPPPQGDVDLSFVRSQYGKQMVLFGNLEVSDIECLPTPAFEKKVFQAIEQGTAGNGRGFVLMPSACPYGRELPPQTLANYCKIIDVIEHI